MSQDKKPSFKHFEGVDFIQDTITRSAFLFAQLTLAEAKKNSLTREQVIKEGTKRS